MNISYLKRLLMLYRFIPTALTLGNVLCGFTAILNTLLIYRIQQQAVNDWVLGNTGVGLQEFIQDRLDAQVPGLIVVSAWLIAGAMVFDMLDGWTARKLNATSAHGLQMDSLADMVTFGVAPAVMVAALARTLSERYIGASFWWVWLLCGVYVSCVALRLALYNVIAIEGGCSDYFRGLPSPGGAAAVSSLVLVYKFSQGELKGIVATVCGKGLLADLVRNGVVAEYALNVLPVYAGLLGLLMVSRVPYRHFGKWLGGAKHGKLKIFILIVFFLCFARHPIIVATVAINAYVLWAPLRSLVGLSTRLPLRRQAKAAGHGTD